jgi:hypothetical protein
LSKSVSESASSWTEEDERELLRLSELEQQLANETSGERLARQAREYRAAFPDRPLDMLAETLERGKKLRASIERKKERGVPLNAEESRHEAESKATRERWAEDDKIRERRWAERAAESES